MKVLISYAFCTTGGVETAIKNRIRNIPRSVCAIDLHFLYDYGGQPIFQGLDCVIHIQSQKNEIQQLIRDGGYDTVIVIDTPSTLDALAEMDYKGTVGLEVHTTYPDNLGYLKKLSSQLISFILVPSLYQKQLVSRYLTVKIPIQILPNAIDTQVFQPLDSDLPCNKKVLLWVGRLDSHKNYGLFLEIAQKLLQLDPSFEFWLIGGLKSGSPEMEKFYDKLYRLRIHMAVKWLPLVPYHKIANIYSWVGKNHGAYVVTSQNESFGMTVLEAMACGCPAIVNLVGALPELAADCSSCQVADFQSLSPETSAQLIHHFLQTHDLSQKALAHSDTVRQRYSSDAVGSSFLQILSTSDF